MACPPKPKRLKLSLRKKTSSESDTRNDSPLHVDKPEITNDYDRPQIQSTEVDIQPTKERISTERTATQRPGLLHLREMLRARQPKFTDWHMLPDLPRSELCTEQAATESQINDPNTSSTPSSLKEWIPLPKPDLSWYKPQRKPPLDLASYYGDPDRYVKLAECDMNDVIGSSLDSFEPKFTSSGKTDNFENNTNSAQYPNTSHNFTVIKPKLAQPGAAASGRTVLKEDYATSKCEDMESTPSTSDSSALRSCPLCQMEFNKIIGQVDIDGHIAACLSTADDDFQW